MRKIFAALLLTLLFSAPAQAHKGGPPFVKLNDLMTQAYPVQVSSVADFSLPQEIAPVNFRVGESISFEIDKQSLGLFASYPENTVFRWDLGDGTKADGLKLSHTYIKGTSYLITINALVEDNEPQLIETFLLNVLPNYNYELPKPVIRANSQQSKDPASDAIEADLAKGVTFSADKSISGSAKIVSYYWDLGDGQTSTDAAVSHSYSPLAGTTLQPMLRLTDANGFYVDSYIWLKDKKAAAKENRLTQGQQLHAFTRRYLGWLIGGVIVASMGLIRLRKRSRKA